jgi:hypothetical protein
VLTESAQHKYQEEREHMHGHVIYALLPRSAACWLVGCILPAQYLSMEEFKREGIEEADVTGVCRSSQHECHDMGVID